MEMLKCCYCGKQIPRHNAVDWKNGKKVTLDYYQYGSQWEREENAFFCSLRCGYAWAQEYMKAYRDRLASK
jgi:hypothetical protein